MGDHDGRAPAHERLVAHPHLPLRLGIESSRGLVEYEHRGGDEQSAGDGDTLAFAGRQGRSALAHDGGVAFG